MKILILLFASFIGFGLASQEATSVKRPDAIIYNAPAGHILEAPAAHVLLDTVEITAVGPEAVASNFR